MNNQFRHGSATLSTPERLQPVWHEIESAKRKYCPMAMSLAVNDNTPPQTYKCFGPECMAWIEMAGQPTYGRCGMVKS